MSLVTCFICGWVLARCLTGSFSKSRRGNVVWGLLALAAITLQFIR